MTDDHRQLLQAWCDRVLSRPSAMCGVFTGDEGEPLGPRARPWDEPDLLISATVDDDGLRLDLDSYGARVPWEIRGIVEVEEADHPWGRSLRVVAVAEDRKEVIWLV